MSAELERALELWEKLVDLPKGSKMSIQQLSDKGVAEEIQDAVDLDPTELTGFLMLRRHFNERILGCSVKVGDMLAGKYDDALSNTKALRDVLWSPELEARATTFREGLKAAAIGYGADPTKIAKVVDDVENLGVMRYGAMKSMRDLRVDQFSSGALTRDKPKVVDAVHVFWSLKDMLEAVSSTRAGISLNLIMDSSQEMFSFFAFGIRNGDNVYMLTDKPDEAHPLHKHMTRRPDRRLERRWQENWFLPYGLLDEMTESFSKTAKSTALGQLGPASRIRPMGC